MPPPAQPVSGALVPLPPPNPLAALGALSITVANAAADLPCPPPHVPPELAAQFDCSALRRLPGAAAYVPRVVAAGALPPAIDLRAHGLVGPTKNQEEVNACIGFAFSTVLDNAARRMGRRDVVSPLHLFSMYADGSDAGEAMLRQPLTDEAVWPFDPRRACGFASGFYAANCESTYGTVPGSASSNPALLAERQRADQMGRLRVVGFEVMPLDPEQIAIVVASGEAISLSLHFHGPSWYGLGDGGDTVPFYPKGVTDGAHVIVVEGYRTTPSGRQFLVHNSWGTGWAQGGYAWIDERMIPLHGGHAHRFLVVDASVPAPGLTGPCPPDALRILGACLPAPPPLPFALPGLPSSI